jgi:aminoglycoside phosphotransferase (APT) family kinase protein
MQKETFEPALRAYYQRTQPDLINPQISLDWVNTKGWESEIYAFTLSYGTSEKPKSEKLVLRLLTGGGTDAGKDEFRVLSVLNQAGYPVPKVFALGGFQDGLGGPFIIMQRIEDGDFSSRFPQTSQDDQKPLKDFIGLFRLLHTLNWRDYVDDADHLAPPDQPFFHFDQEMAIYDRLLIQSGFTMFVPLMAWIKSRREKAYCAMSSLIHRDFHPDNILEDQDGKLFVIDWTSAQISDYRFDLAWTLILFLAYSGKARRQMVLDEYERQLGHAVPELDFFEVISILRRIGAVMISIAAGADKLGMRPETVQAMQNDQEPLMQLFKRLRELTELDLPEIETFIEEMG